MGQEPSPRRRAAANAKASATDMEALRTLLHLYQSDGEALPQGDVESGGNAMVMTTLGAENLPVSLAEPGQSAPTTGDWPAAVRMVEQAASVIEDYEQRFRDIEIDARAFIERIDEEQQRLLTYVASLEVEVVAAEERGRRAEAALDEVRLQAWEERLMRRHAETRAADAEAEVTKCETYLRRVYEILDRLDLMNAGRTARS